MLANAIYCDTLEHEGTLMWSELQFRLVFRALNGEIVEVLKRDWRKESTFVLDYWKLKSEKIPLPFSKSSRAALSSYPPSAFVDHFFRIWEGDKVINVSQSILIRLQWRNLWVPSLELTSTLIIVFKKWLLHPKEVAAEMFKSDNGELVTMVLFVWKTDKNDGNGSEHESVS